MANLEAGYLALLTEAASMRAELAVLQGSDPASAVEQAMTFYAGILREAELPLDFGAEERLRRGLRRRLQLE